jgi:hypothetical protein
MLPFGDHLITLAEDSLVVVFTVATGGACL